MAKRISRKNARAVLRAAWRQQKSGRAEFRAAFRRFQERNGERAVGKWKSGQGGQVRSIGRRTRRELEDSLTHAESFT